MNGLSYGAKSIFDLTIFTAKVGAAVGTIGYGISYIAPRVIEESLQSVITGPLQGIETVFSESVEKALSKIDAEVITERIATGINKGSDAFYKNLNTGKSAKDLGDSMERAWDGFDFSGRADTVSSDLGRSFDIFSGHITEGMTDAFGNFLNGMEGLLFRHLPVFLGAGALTTTVSLGTPLALYYLYYKAKHNIGRPKLATDVHQISLSQPLFSPISYIGSFFGKKSVKPSYDTETTRRITEVSKAMQNVRKNGGPFPNVLFYGPGGTGKTMISNILAKESGMSYVKMSGGDLAQYIKRGEHVTELNKLFDNLERSWRPWSVRPWVLFIDEAESLCGDRNLMPSAELLELQNAFLNRTGTQSEKFALVLATNLLERLDPAVLSRMDYKIFIGPPAEAERVRIIKTYLPQFFTSKERSNIFTDETVDEMAKNTEGFTGRSLFKLLNAIKNQKAITDQKVLTKEAVMRTVNDFAEQEQEIASRLEKKKNAQKPDSLSIRP